MLVREVMKREVVTAHPDMTTKEAVRLLSEHSITAMPVVDKEGVLLGVISEADVIEDVLLPDPRAHERPVPPSSGPHASRVGQVMTRLPLTVRADSDLAAAAQVMSETAVKSLPVVDGDRVVGVVSRADIVKALARGDETIESEVDDLVRMTGRDWLVDVEDGVVFLDGPEDLREQDLAQALVSTVRGVVGVRFRGGHASRPEA